jgi:hypothetical protein
VADCDDHHVSGMLGFCPKCGLGDATEDYPVTPPAHAHVWHYYDGNETEGTEYRCRCGAMTDDQPAPAADEARCAFVGCGGVRDDVFHEPCLPGGAFHDHKACHPFQPAPTPAPLTPPATEERWVVVQGEDDDCGVCGRAKLRFVDPEYEPGGLRCTECDWFEPHPDGDHEWRRSCGMSCGNEPPTPPAVSPAPNSPQTPPATEPVAALVEAVRSGLEMYDWTARTHHNFDRAGASVTTPADPFCTDTSVQGEETRP